MNGIESGPVVPRRFGTSRWTSIWRRAALACTVLASVFMVAGFLATAADAHGSGWPGGVWQPEAPTYGDTVVTNQPLTMNDGTTLIADIEYPSDLSTGQRAAGTFPVLLTLNPYGCQAPITAATSANTYFVTRGYIFATVCIRGTGRSGGQFDFVGTRSQQDGPEIADWAADIPGSNGIVGLTGCSYLGFTQLYVAGWPHSPVKEISPFCAANTFYNVFLGNGMPTESADAYLAAAPFIIGPSTTSFITTLSASIFSGGADAYNGAFWQERNLSKYISQIVRNRIPALMWSGYQDAFVNGSMDLYAGFQNAYDGRPSAGPPTDEPLAMLPGQPASGRYQIVMGPWEHGGGISQELELEWYDTWLKHVHTGMQDTSTPIHVLDRTNNAWVNASDFPMTENYSPYYLNSTSTLGSNKPASSANNSLVWAQPSTPGASVSYTTKPFAAGAQIAGPIAATIYASSSSTNLELIATLDDVDPAGNVTELSHGDVIGSLRADDPQLTWHDDKGLVIRPWCDCSGDQYLSPNAVYPFNVELNQVVASVNPGDSLRLTLTTQTATSVCESYSVAEDPCTPTAPQAATLPGTYKVFDGPSTPSAINLPLLPLGTYKATGTGAIPTDWGPPAPSWNTWGSPGPSWKK
jgi:uncharacterized protein